MDQNEHTAVNQILIAIGSTPVNEGSTNADTLIATTKLSSIKAKVLSKGWWFNREHGWTLYPNPQGEIVLPSGTLDIDPSDPQADYIQRGKRLYDRGNRTYKFAKSVQVDMIVDLTLEELPAPAFTYIVARAAREMHVSIDGETTKLADLQNDEMDALIDLRKSELRNADVNMLNSPTGLRMRYGIRRPVR